MDAAGLVGGGGICTHTGKEFLMTPKWVWKCKREAQEEIQKYNKASTTNGCIQTIIFLTFGYFYMYRYYCVLVSLTTTIIPV
jgi:hypothetical protein